MLKTKLYFYPFLIYWIGGSSFCAKSGTNYELKRFQHFGRRLWTFFLIKTMDFDFQCMNLGTLERLGTGQHCSPAVQATLLLAQLLFSSAGKFKSAYPFKLKK